MWSYFYMNELDSAKKYANSLDTSVQLNKSYQLAIFGDDSALDFYQESVNAFLGNKEEDLLALCDHYRNLIEINVILGSYDEATSTLLKLNKDFPEYGGYGYIKNDPGFDKVKRDHIQFKEALRNLKMPKPISIPQLFNQ